MIEDAVGGPKKTVMIDGRPVEVTEPVPIQPTYVDVLTENRMSAGVVGISLAVFIRDTDDIAEARVVARLRFTVSAAEHIRDMLNNVLAKAEAAKQSAN